MKLSELTLLAENQKFIYLVLPRKSLPKGSNTRLAGRQGPLGHICNVKGDKGDYEVLAVFESQKILDYINREIPDG
jgi:hypothetical protein